MSASEYLKIILERLDCVSEGFNTYADWLCKFLTQDFKPSKNYILPSGINIMTDINKKFQLSKQKVDGIINRNKLCCEQLLDIIKKGGIVNEASIAFVRLAISSLIILIENEVKRLNHEIAEVKLQILDFKLITQIDQKTRLN